MGSIPTLTLTHPAHGEVIVNRADAASIAHFEARGYRRPGALAETAPVAPQDAQGAAPAAEAEVLPLLTAAPRRGRRGAPTREG
jgi:hypothetical protein